MDRSQVKKIVPPIFVLMIIVFSIVCILLFRQSIESKLTDKVNQSIKESNISLSETLEVEFSGRDAYVTGMVENSDDKERIYNLVDNVEGVKLVYTDLKMQEVTEPIVIKEPIIEQIVQEKIEEPKMAVSEERIEVIQEPVVVQEIVQEPETIVYNNYQDVEKQINAKIIYFDLAKTFIKESYEDELQEVQSILSEYPDIRIKITGYADRRGTAEDNMDLSKRRALKVQSRLVDSGVNSEQLEIDYKGEVIRDDLYYWRYYKYDRKVEFKFLGQVSH